MMDISKIYRPDRIFYILAAVGMIALLNMADSLYMIGVINVISLAVFTIGMSRLQGKLFTPFILIALGLYLFHSGHLWIYLFTGIDIASLQDYNYGFSAEFMIDVYRYSTQLLITYYGVGFIFVQPQISYPADTTARYTLSRDFKIFILLFYLAALYFGYQRSLVVEEKGYGAGFSSETGLSYTISLFVDLLLILAIYVYRYDRRQLMIYIGLLLLKALYLMFMTGNRGSSVVYMVVLGFIILNYSYLRHSKRLRNTIYIGLPTFALIVLPFISLTRVGESSLGLAGNFIYFFDEFGGSMKTVLLSADYISHVDTLDGLQILQSSLTVFPMSTYFFGDLISQSASIGGLLNHYYDIRGLGGSLIAQLTLNFGFSLWGFLAMAVFSLIVSWVNNQLMNKKHTIYGFIIFIGLFIGLFTTVRGEWYDTVSQFKNACYLALLLFFCKEFRIRAIRVVKPHA